MPERTQQNSRWSGYYHLLMARMKELKREPEVVFWVFGFPLFWRLVSASPSVTSLPMRRASR